MLNHPERIDALSEVEVSRDPEIKEDSNRSQSDFGHSEKSYREEQGTIPAPLDTLRKSATRVV